MAASKLEILEHRLQSLEKIVFGAQSEDVDYPKVILLYFSLFCLPFYAVRCDSIEIISRQIQV